MRWSKVARSTSLGRQVILAMSRAGFPPQRWASDGVSLVATSIASKTGVLGDLVLPEGTELTSQREFRGRTTIRVRLTPKLQ